MPFLIAIFYALQGYPYDQNYVQFLWLPSLGEPDPMYILPVLSALSTWIMSKQTSSGATGAACATTKDYDNLYAFIHWLHLLNFPSGLVIYWIVSNVFQFDATTFHLQKLRS